MLISELCLMTKKCTVNSKKYYLCYKDYSTIDSKTPPFLKVKCSVNYVFQNHPELECESTLVFVQHNIGFIKYHNSRTNIYMPACFLTKMAAIGKNDGSEIEQNKTVGLYKWRYCLPNSSTAYTIPLNVIYTYLINPLGLDRASSPIVIVGSCIYNNGKKETWLYYHLI